jgi:toxin ParE1/3/4
MAEITWTARALDRLEVIKEYISRTDRVAAIRVVEAIFARTERLKRLPRIGQEIIAPANREIREIVYGHYRIFYEVVSEDSVEVISILHAAMNIRDYFDL